MANGLSENHLSYYGTALFAEVSLLRRRSKQKNLFGVHCGTAVPMNIVEKIFIKENVKYHGTCAIDRAKSNKQFFTRSLITFSLIFLSIISIYLEHFVLFFIFLLSSVISSCVLFLSQTTISTNKYDGTSKTFWIRGFGDGLLNQYSVNGKIKNTWIMISLFDKEANAKKEKKGT